jgi:alkanesulfonate monooxygenase SsuD/methylene tetrahydromethanopterin reductase-like flavin-dependent oxidoreductase (luciferase family)
MTLAKASAAVVLRIPCEPMKAIFALRGQGTPRCYSLTSMTTHQDRHPIRVGALLWPQQTDWPQLSRHARLADDVGLDSLWTWDHLHAIVGDPLQPIFEGWTALAAWAVETERVALGLMVGANTFRNPGLTAKAAVTLDHISGGRAWLGLGGAWFEYEHIAAGIDFGAGFGQRLDWLDEAVRDITRVLAGETVTSTPGGRYDFRELQHHPQPLRGPGSLPIMIGGGGEKKTLRTVAAYADGWNVGGSLETLRHKVDVLNQHCQTVGRDPLEIEFTTNRHLLLRDDADEAARVLQARLDHNGSAHVIDREIDFVGNEQQVAALWRRYLDLGFTHVIADLPAPFDRETIERLPRLRELVAAG